MESISDKYLKQQKELHKRLDYGVASSGYAPLVSKIINSHKIKSLCDYGAGKKQLLTSLNELGTNPFKYYPYDPVFPEYGLPVRSQLVCCIDVLEHIEIEFLDKVLDELYSITALLCFISIHTGPAAKKLNDGRNAHLIQAPNSWWLEKLAPRFEIHQMQTTKAGFWIIGSERNRRISINAKN